MTEPADLVPHNASADQLSLFGSDAPSPLVPSVIPDAELVRRRLNAVLTTARAAHQMPWSERDTRMWRTVFPQMANWLPDDEADQLRFEFAQEIERLLTAA